MKSPWIRVFGGMVIGCVMAVMYLLVPLGAEEGFSFLNRSSGSLSMNEFLQGLMVGLIIILFGRLVGRNASNTQETPVRVSTLDFYRRRRLRRLRNTRLR